MLVSTALATLISVTGFQNQVTIKYEDVIMHQGVSMVGMATTNLTTKECTIQLKRGNEAIISTLAHEFAHCVAHSNDVFGHGPLFDNYNENMHWHLDLEYTTYSHQTGAGFGTEFTTVEHHH